MLSIDDVKSYEDKMWLDGHSLALEDVQTAHKGYLIELKSKEEPELLLEMQLNAIQKYNDYLVKFLKKQNKMMLSTILEDQ